MTKIAMTMCDRMRKKLGNQGNQGNRSLKLDPLGMTVSEINSLLAGRSGIKRGVVVTSVSWGGLADLAGVVAGDVVSEVDGHPTMTLKDLADLLAERTIRSPVRFLFRGRDMWRLAAFPFELIGGAAAMSSCIDKNLSCVHAQR